MNIGVSITSEGESFLCLLLIQGTKNNFVHDLFLKVFQTDAPRRLENMFNPCIDFTMEKIFLCTKSFIILDLVLILISDSPLVGALFSNSAS